MLGVCMKLTPNTDDLSPDVDNILHHVRKIGSGETMQLIRVYLGRDDEDIRQFFLHGPFLLYLCPASKLADSTYPQYLSGNPQCVYHLVPTSGFHGDGLVLDEGLFGGFEIAGLPMSMREAGEDRGSKEFVGASGGQMDVEGSVIAGQGLGRMAEVE